MKLINLINFVSAHTGNDAVNHGFTVFDEFLGFLLMIGSIILIMFLIKKLGKTNER